ncbi:hypothetical protein [Saccharibacillus endophyticus]|uniref:Uncharacterized protein n=1 Tax=Saccharibacillus endophyticus TaxID=2060666 RepID=A0ABQ1ZW40_9BACL|nr:hypothetical protein [Saccharibacillus endophyticus]GGH79135.1 hypothetical protein GCM10007362_25470 [Saccharibacillus endophyticus]
MDWIWALGFLLLMLAILAGIVYAIVSSIVESRIERLVLTQLNHMDRKQNDRFELLDRQLQELNGSMRRQEERLKKLELSVVEQAQKSNP